MKIYSWSNANNLKFTRYENGKRITIFDVCQIARDYRTGNEWLNDLHTTNYELNRGYDLDSYNCVQSSMDILLQGTFSSESKKYKDKIKSIYGNVFKLDFYPNKVYNKLIDC